MIGVNNSSLEIGQVAEEQPFLSNRSHVESTTTCVSSRSSSAISDDCILSAARADLPGGDSDAESQRLVTLPHGTNIHGSSIIGSGFGDCDTEGHLQSARRLENGSDCEEEDAQFRVRLSRSKIRWGVLRMPDTFYTQFRNQDHEAQVEHLTFGIEEQGVTPPESGPGHLYA